MPLCSPKAHLHPILIPPIISVKIKKLIFHGQFSSIYVSRNLVVRRFFHTFVHVTH